MAWISVHESIDGPKLRNLYAATVTSVDYNPAKRTATFRYTVTVGEATFREEVTLYG